MARTNIVVNTPVGKLDVEDFNSRVGRFDLPVEVIDDQPEIARAILASVLVMDVDYEFQTKSMIYTARSEYFDSWATKGSSWVNHAPWYDVEYDLATGVVTWKKQPPESP